MLIGSPVRERNKHQQFHEVQPNAAEDSETVSYKVKIKSKFWNSGLSADERLSVKIVSSNTQQTLEVRHFTIYANLTHFYRNSDANAF